MVTAVGEITVGSMSNRASQLISVCFVASISCRSTYKNCFLGKELVGFLISHKFVGTVDAAVAFGNEMLKLVLLHTICFVCYRFYKYIIDFLFFVFLKGMFEHVTRDHVFKNENL